MTCRSCNKEVHYCSSCDSDNYLYEGYCDKNCFKKSYEYGVYSNKIKVFWNSLNEIQQSDLWALWDNGILNSDIYENMIDEVIKV